MDLNFWLIGMLYHFSPIFSILFRTYSDFACLLLPNLSGAFPDSYLHFLVTLYRKMWHKRRTRRRGSPPWRSATSTLSGSPPLYTTSMRSWRRSSRTKRPSTRFAIWDGGGVGVLWRIRAETTNMGTKK